MLIWHSNPAFRASHISSGGSPASGKMNQGLLDRALRPSWRWGSRETMSVKMKPPAPSPSLLPEPWLAGLHLIHTVSTKRLRGGGGLRKLAQGICPQNGFRLLDSTGDKWDILRKKDTQTGFPYSNQTSHKGESRIKTFWSHRVPGHCLRMLWRKWSVHPNQEPTRKRKTSVWERRQKGTPRWGAAPGGQAGGRPGGRPVQRSKREI